MNKRTKAKIMCTGMVISTLFTANAQAQNLGKNQESQNTEEKSNLNKHKERKSVKKTNVTYNEIAEYLLKSSKAYNPNIDKKQIIEGFKSKENQQINRLDSLIMISRAFGTLSEPTGHNKRIEDKNVSFTDIPSYAKPHIDNLIKGGVLVNTKDKKINGSEIMTIEEVETIVKRIWAFKGTNLKDDFYSSINKKWLEESNIPDGEYEAGGPASMQRENDKKVNAIIKGISNGNPRKGSKEEKIKNLYLNSLDLKSRNKLGNKPIKKYLDAIESAKDIKELNKINRNIIKEIGTNAVFSTMSMSDYSKGTKYLDISSSTDTWMLEYNEQKDRYAKFYKKLLILNGESEKEATNNLNKYMDLLKKIETSQEYNDEKINLKELEQKVPNLEISQALATAGYNNLSVSIKVSDMKELETFNKIFTNKNLDIMKTFMKINLAKDNADKLSEDYFYALNEFHYSSTGATQTKFGEKEATKLVSSNLNEYIDELFVNKHFSEESKKDVEKIIKQFIDVYKDNIKNLDWMNESTKKEAIKKLDAMKFLVGYPSSFESPFENTEILSKEDGGSYFDNMSKIKLTRLKSDAENIDKSFSTEQFGIGLAGVNAAYGLYTNIMQFPAGILQAPLYDSKASLEENLAGIGVIIGHEISHAFDNSGAQYDSNGKENNWWSKEDYKAFEERCKRVIDFFDGVETAPGIKVNGEYTLGENISDIAGVGTALNILSKTNNPDYDLFFKSYSKAYTKTYSREVLQNTANGDLHSPNNTRVNRVLVNFEQFHKTYNIQDGDGMYVAPYERVNVWESVNSNVELKPMIGTDRYDTAIKISKEGWSASNTVILVNGNKKHMVDGLSATPLSNSKNAPILLSNGKNIDDNTLKEIKRLKASNIIVIGGEDSISKSVIEQLNKFDKSISVKRIGGKTRYETSLNVAKEMSHNKNIEKIYVSAGEGEADALSISSVAGNEKSPIILTHKDGLDQASYDYLKSKNIQEAYFIGGEEKISNQAVSQIDKIVQKNVSNNRIAGKDRQETNAKVIENFYKDSNLKAIALSKDNDLIDALSVGPFASKENIPVVIATNDLNKSQEGVLSKKKSTTIYQAGGGISSTVINKIKKLLDK